MEGSLQILKKKLIQCWVDAHRKIADIPKYEAQVVSKKYADGSRYNLKDFNAGKLRAGGKMLAEPPSSIENYYEYGFDTKGFPVTVRFSHVYNKIDWLGFYKKEERLFEYIEFCLTTGVVSSIQRLTFNKKNKTTYQFFGLNGKTNSLIVITQPIEKIIDDINKKPKHFFYDFCEFEYVDNKIVRGNGIANYSLGEYEYSDSYSYNSSNQLLKIERLFGDGRTSFEYIKPTYSLKQIIKELSVLFCDYLVAILKTKNYKQPLFVIELLYQFCDSYWPSLSVLTEKNKTEKEDENSLYLFMSGAFTYTIENVPIGLKQLYAEFYQLIERTDNWEAGRKMLIETAKLMTQSKLKGEMPVTDDFIVFPVEWQLDVEGIENVLFRCGASKANIKKWKELNWF